MDNTQNIEYRIAKLEENAQQHPLIWTPKKGDFLIGFLKAVGPFNGHTTFCLLEDDKKVTHRVALNSSRIKALYEQKAQMGDLISIQFIGKERGYHGGMIDVFNIVVDKG